MALYMYTCACIQLLFLKTYSLVHSIVVIQQCCPSVVILKLCTLGVIMKWPTHRVSHHAYTCNQASLLPVALYKWGPNYAHIGVCLCCLGPTPQKDYSYWNLSTWMASHSWLADSQSLARELATRSLLCYLVKHTTGSWAAVGGEGRQTNYS